MEIFCKSPLKDSLLYPLPIYNCAVLHCETKADIFDKDCFPVPPTPINIAFPLGCIIILEILNTCCMAYLKKTSSSFPDVSTLYSYILESKKSTSFLDSSSCSYIFSSVSRVKMFVKVIPKSPCLIFSVLTPSLNRRLIDEAVFINHSWSSWSTKRSQKILSISWYQRLLIFSTVLAVSIEHWSIPWKTLLISLKLNW